MASGDAGSTSIVVRQSGTIEPHLRVFVGGEMVKHPLPQSGQVTIGRSSDVEINIDDGSISRRHAILHVGPLLQVEDLGSTNGTWVRQAKVEPGRKVELRAGEVFEIGRVNVVVVRWTALASEPEAAESQEQLIERVASGDISVLLQGETGVGKEVLARRLHQLSPRHAKPFVGIDCASLPEALLESELFGHERGAYTGATHDKPGLFEAADGGTVFLDEIGELTPPVQAKLLRVIETREVRRIGELKTRSFDVRFICATNRDLDEQAKKGAFRPDLLFRLNCFVFHIPPLRERTGQIAGLAAGFVEEACARLGRKERLALSPESLALLEAHRWPGNVRELRNAIERAVLLCRGAAISPADLPESVRAPGAGAAPLEGGDERQRILDALNRCGGNQTRAAKLLGISRRTLVTRLGKLGVPRPKM